MTIRLGLFIKVTQNYGSVENNAAITL